MEGLTSGPSIIFQDVQKTFTQVLVPLAKAMAGTMVPWSELSIVYVQSLVNKAFGESLYVIQRYDVWCGLVVKQKRWLDWGLNPGPSRHIPNALTTELSGLYQQIN